MSRTSSSAGRSQKLLALIRRPSTLVFCGLLCAAVGLTVMGLREDAPATVEPEDESLENDLLSAVGVRKPAPATNSSNDLDDTLNSTESQIAGSPLRLPLPGSESEDENASRFNDPFQHPAEAAAGVQQAQFEQRGQALSPSFGRPIPTVQNQSPLPFKPTVVSNGPAWLSGTIE